MNLTRNRIRSIGWASLLTVCTALTTGLTLRVNALKSEVHQVERRIVSIRKEIAFLETEYQTRSNQHQLKTLNDVEFGYIAPRAQQYIEGERQLAVLAKPRDPGAPAPIRIAVAPGAEELAKIIPMVSPITGARASEPDSTAQQVPLSAEHDPVGAAINAENLGTRLSRIGSGKAGSQ
ncbi:MAG: hypothetical protein N2423_04600 [Novosphingobium sp.]|nr:hypothetical protein [Novosphingobium sp.]